MRRSQMPAGDIHVRGALAADVEGQLDGAVWTVLQTVAVAGVLDGGDVVRDEGDQAESVGEELVD